MQKIMVVAVCSLVSLCSASEPAPQNREWSMRVVIRLIEEGDEHAKIIGEGMKTSLPPDRGNDYYRAALKKAIIFNRPDTVRALVENGADSNAPDSKDQPLIFQSIDSNKSCRGRSEEKKIAFSIFQFLIESGANLHQKRYGNTLFMHACAKDFSDSLITDVLLEKDPQLAPTPDMYTVTNEKNWKGNSSKTFVTFGKWKERLWIGGQNCDLEAGKREAHICFTRCRRIEMDTQKAEQYFNRYYTIKNGTVVKKTDERR